MGERRLARRYDLTLPVAVRIPTFAEPRTGKTRDISTRGVYFVVDETLATGSELDFTLKLPSQTPDTDVLVQARGRVVRVEPNPEGKERGVGIAAVIEKFDIVREQPKHN
jgi:hypothetical protein